MTATCPKDGQPFEEDLDFLRDGVAYGVPRTRLVCLAGHSVYRDYGPARKRDIPPARCCSACGQPVYDGRRLKCERCRKPEMARSAP